MSSVPSPSSSPPSRSTCNTSLNTQVEAATNNGACLGHDKKPNFTDALHHLDSPQCIERFRRYDDGYAHRLLAKYFSNKNFYGGNIFDVQTTVGDEIIKSTRSYVDPVIGFEDQFSNGSTPPADSQANIHNGEHVVKN